MNINSGYTLNLLLFMMTVGYLFTVRSHILCPTVCLRVPPEGYPYRSSSSTGMAKRSLSAAISLGKRECIWMISRYRYRPICNTPQGSVDYCLSVEILLFSLCGCLQIVYSCLPPSGNPPPIVLGWDRWVLQKFSKYEQKGAPRQGTVCLSHTLLVPL